jgi:predicted membrane-bound mannosyltransferase
MWGPAGVGKSALAQTYTEKVKKLGYLGAAFFFSINGRQDHRSFFVTLAYRLSMVLPDYRQLLDATVMMTRRLSQR